MYGIFFQLVKKLGVNLLVMGTVGRTGIPGLIIGNSAESILSQFDGSVLAVKPPDFVTAVTLEERSKPALVGELSGEHSGPNDPGT